MALAQLVYVHDPMCSWCWAFMPSWNALIPALPEGIQTKRLLGGLAPDSNRPMLKEMQMRISQTWRFIEAEHGTPFNHEFWERCQPVRSTYPACRAVIAARFWNAEEAMIRAIQEAYYLKAQNPSVPETLLQCAHELGLPIEPFAERLYSEHTDNELMQEIRQGQDLGANGFPSLILLHQNSRYPIRVDYNDPSVMVERISRALAAKR
ncbi:DsbA family protein [Pokkaliibacter sp. CJK22405]|uniref:DsbA family protein n=1 Tax=Pokkaliibacter sp. CJK22405 TaxID=3384615 RepID=UPI0039852F87